MTKRKRKHTTFWISRDGGGKGCEGCCDDHRILITKRKPRTLKHPFCDCVEHMNHDHDSWLEACGDIHDFIPDIGPGESKRVRIELV